MNVQRILVALVFAAVVPASVAAQKLGFIGGPSMSHSTMWCEDEGAGFKPIPGAGFHVGALFEWDITNRWGWDAAVMYEMRSSAFDLSYSGVDTTNYFNRQLFYLNVPVHVYVNFPIRNRYVISTFVGPVFTCALHGRDIAWENTEMRKPVMYEKEDLFGKEGRIVRCEIAAEIGMAFKYRNFQGRLSYQYGINNLTKDNYLYTLPMTSGTKTYLTQGTLKLSFAYLFDLRK